MRHLLWSRIAVWFLILAAVFALGIWIQQQGPVFQYLFYGRGAVAVALFLVGLPFLPKPTVDRGTAIEVAWQSHMRHPDSTFAEWRHLIRQGRLPTPVFNATVVNNGHRFLVSPMSFTHTEAKKEADFNKLHPGGEIPLTTAARLSTTFPYVSPICRHHQGKPFLHVADGGFFDNFGVFTSADWLDDYILPNHERLKLKLVLFLEISSFPASPPPTDPDRNRGFLYFLAGPLLALSAVRNSTQTARDLNEVRDLKARWQGRLAIENVVLRFPALAMGEAFSNKKGGYDPPLSWKLTEAQKEAIREGWRQSLGTAEVKQIEAFWKGSGV